jgi:hypothetical protein
LTAFVADTQGIVPGAIRSATVVSVVVTNSALAVRLGIASKSDAYSWGQLAASGARPESCTLVDGEVAEPA